MTAPALGTFASRHIGPRGEELRAMLEAVGASSLDQLMGEVVPDDIRLSRAIELPPADSEAGYFRHLRAIAAKNVVSRSYIGLGYHDSFTPAVIQRNVFENPGWYTPYTPYQAEIAQGRLESLLNFQTMVSDLTGMEVANASLLDEATAAAEAMTLLKRVSKKTSANTFLVSQRVFPQVRELLVTRAKPLGIALKFIDASGAISFDDAFGLYLQSPDDRGEVGDFSGLIANAHDAGVLVAVGADLLASVLITSAGAMGADVVVGNSQRFGVPLGYGGPHAAFFATREAFVRQAPGRIIGVSIDAKGRPAYRMALQTREQHIRREKATSNICTAQALLANMAAMYAVYHGPDGLTAIARRVHGQAQALAMAVTGVGFKQTNDAFFDTLRFIGEPAKVEAVRSGALARKINFYYPEPGVVQVALNETVADEDLQDIADIFATAMRAEKRQLSSFQLSVPQLSIPHFLSRSTPFLTHPVFNAHHSETEMMRYIRSLERKDIGLDTAMIPLGSCTMKLNAAAEMMPVSWPEFGRMHPFVPVDQAKGYQQVFLELESALKAITGFAAVSLQPNSGAQGEFAGLLAIQAYHQSRGDGHRTLCLIPQSAHGTNPASAALAGLPVVIVACDDKGNINLDDLRAKAEKHAATLSCLMVTYPSTHGVYETRIREICAIVHESGGQVYMDGANMNAQVCLTSPASIGADVCHLNLHKTFAIPHGGGGPGMGPIGVASHLAPFLPGHSVIRTGGAQAIPAVSAAPWGSASILLISYGYIRMLGADGMKSSTEIAILNANYLKTRIEKAFPVLYTATNGRVAHECIFDLRPLKAQSGIDETDVAKRLMDYGFHAPTVSFPVPGTLMVEPTESEPKPELDRFIDAMLAIRQEIQDVIDGTSHRADNALKHAPHTAQDVSVNDWAHAYSRESAAFPVDSLRHTKFWPAVSRIDNPYGDRNLFCSCPPIDASDIS